MDTFLRCQILNILIFLSKYAHSFIRIFIQNFDKISRRRAAALQRIRLSVNKCYGTKTEKYFSTFKTILGLFTSENSQCVSTNCCCCCRLDPDNAFQPKYWYKHLSASWYFSDILTEENTETSNDVSIYASFSHHFCHFLSFTLADRMNSIAHLPHRVWVV